MDAEVCSCVSRCLEEPSEDSFGCDLLVVALISFLMPVFRLLIHFIVSGVFGDVFFCQVRRPPNEGSASSKVTSGGVATPSTTAHAGVSVKYVIVCDLCV